MARSSLVLPGVPPASEFDPLPLLAALPRLTLRHQHKDTAPLREWAWPSMRPYNGFTHRERVRMWQLQWWLITVGALPRPSVCGLCGAHGRMELHNEDYYDVLSSQPMCRRCHGLLHKGRGTEWRYLVRQYAKTGKEWYCLLPPNGYNLAGFLRTRAGVDPMAGLPPLRNLPDECVIRMPHRHRTRTL